MRHLFLGLFLVVSGCAEAVDDQPVNLGEPSTIRDTGTASSKDTGGATPKDTSAPEPTDTYAPVEDTSIEDTTVEEPDTTVADTEVPDTYVPPPDTGGGGACMYCSTGTCATPISDYTCLLNCLLDGYLDCDYDPAKSMPCTCKF